jgi:hypothetical protein
VEQESHRSTIKEKKAAAAKALRLGATVLHSEVKRGGKGRVIEVLKHDGRLLLKDAGGVVHMIERDGKMMKKDANGVLHMLSEDEKRLVALAKAQEEKLVELGAKGVHSKQEGQADMASGDDEFHGIAAGGLGRSGSVRDFVGRKAAAKKGTKTVV